MEDFDLKLTNSLLGDLIVEVARLADATERMASQIGNVSQGSGSSNTTPAGRSPRGTCEKQADGRFKWTIPNDVELSTCKKCGAEVYWVKSKNDKWVIVGKDFYGHMDVCGKGADGGEDSLTKEIPF